MLFLEIGSGQWFLLPFRRCSMYHKNHYAVIKGFMWKKPAAQMREKTLLLLLL